MTFLGYCIPCQYGDHEAHHEIIQHAPKDGVGGAKCRCKGECVEQLTTGAKENMLNVSTNTPKGGPGNGRSQG